MVIYYTYRRSPEICRCQCYFFGKHRLRRVAAPFRVNTCAHIVWISRHPTHRETVCSSLIFQTMPKRGHTPKNVIGPAIQRHRIELGWSQAKLATECQLLGWDISRGIVAALEGRVRWAGDYEVALLAKVLRTPISTLYPVSIDWSELGYVHISTKPKTRRSAL